MKQQVNLYRPELKPRKVLFSSSHMVFVLALVVVTLSVYQYVSWLELDAARGQASRAEKALAAAETRLEIMRVRYPIKPLDVNLQRRLEARNLSLAKNQDVVDKLTSGYFGSVTGLSGHLEGFARQHVAGTWLTGVRVVSGGKGVALEGRALLPELIPEYIDRLSDESVFEDQVFSSLNLQTTEDSFTDEIEFDVRSAGVAPRNDS